MVFQFRFGDARNGFLRNDQHMCRRLRFDIAKGKYHVVFIDNGSRDFTRNDFLKQRLAHDLPKKCFVGNETSNCF